MACNKIITFFLFIILLHASGALAQQVVPVPISPGVPRLGPPTTLPPSPAGQLPNVSVPFPQAGQPGGGPTRVEIPQTVPGQAPPSPGPGEAVITETATTQSVVVGEETSDLEKYISGKAPKDLLFDIKQFGYDLFLNRSQAFPAGQGQFVPVGPDYVIGPGDEIHINLWGGVELGVNLQVSRDGTIDIPKVGTRGVTGLTFEELKQLLQKELSSAFTNFEMSVSMGQLRTMRVYVVGKAKKPGAYTTSSMSTLVNALFDSGGPSKSGTMRDLQVIRSGQVLVHLDLYDFLIKGRKGNDIRLMPEDVILIPPIGPIVGIAGDVNSPAIYELKGKTRISDLIKMAGGLSAKAYLQRVQVERVFESRAKNIVDLNLKDLKDKNDIVLENGDVVKVFPIVTNIMNKVILQGNVYRPGEYAWRDGMRVRDLIKSTKDLLPDTHMDIARIDRQVPPDYHPEYRMFNLGKLLLENDEQENIRLQANDVVVILNKWQVQPKEKVRTEGALYRPGEYEFRPNMRLSDLVKLSGGLQPHALPDTAELTRVTATPQGPKTEKIAVYLAEALMGDSFADIPLQRDDYLFVRAVPEWDLYKIVTINGEVRSPGKYTIEKGERLSSLLMRTGGMTDKAYLRGAVFSRESVKKVQQAQLTDMVNRLEREVLSSGTSEASSAMTPEDAQVKVQENKQKLQFVQSLKQLEAKGRMVISLNYAEKLRNTENDLELEEGDSLYIPPLIQSVQVIGAVFNQSAFTYKQGKDHSHYISMCGGYTKNADKKSIYIVKADGRALRPKGSILSWSSDSNQWTGGGAALEPGDTIVVPDRLEKVAWLRNIKDITQILANVATSAGIVFVGMK